MENLVKIEFSKVCPACANDCPFLSLNGTNLYGDGKIVHTVWYCSNRDMCVRIWERMQEAVNNVRPD